MVSLLLALIYLAFISLGLPDSLLGAGWPAMHLELGVPISSMGVVTMVISACTILSSLCSNTLTRKLGTRVVTVASVFLTAAALFGFSFCTAFWQLILVAVPYGLGAGAIDAALNNYVALHYSSRHMSWLHCFWGVGTIISPFIMGYALTSSVWQNGYRIVGFLQLAIAAVLLISLPVWRVHKVADAAIAQKKLSVGGALKIKGVPFLLLGFFAYCAAEATAMAWASTYFVQVKDVSVVHAARFASLFYIGMTAGRFAGGFIMQKLGDRNMILLGAAVLSCGIVALLLPIKGTALSMAAFVVLGLGCAPIYPCIIHATPQSFGAENAGAIIGIQMASAYAGSTLMPPLFGVLGKAVGFWILPLYLSVFFVLMLVMTMRCFAVTSKARTQSPASDNPQR